MGETARALGKRLVEHQKQTTSEVQEHHSKPPMRSTERGSRSLTRRRWTSKEKLKEVIHIRRQRLTLSKDGVTNF